MLAPDEQLALDILDALDQRNLPELDPALNREKRQERRRLEQRCKMASALLGWLQRWMDDPQHERLRARDDPLWEAISALHDQLQLSEVRLSRTAAEMDETAARPYRTLGGASADLGR